MRAASIFKTPDRQIEELKVDLQEVNQEIQKAEGVTFHTAGTTPDSLDELKSQRALIDLKIRKTTLSKAIKALELMTKGGTAAQEAAEAASFELEAIINWKYRPALVFNRDHEFRPGDIKKLGTMEETGRSWQDLVKAALTAVNKSGQTIKQAAQNVARVQHSSGGVVGTAWVAEAGKLITNRHVVVNHSWFYQEPSGTWEPFDGHRGDLNYNAVWNAAGADMDQFDVETVIPAPGADASKLAADDNKRPPLPIVRDVSDFGSGSNLEDILAGRVIAVIGHPSSQGDNPTDELDAVFGGAALELKRFMPGRLGGKPLGNYYGQPALMHDCSTLKGASGSCVIDLGPVDIDFTQPLPPTFGHVIGLHFGGAWKQSNYAVPTWELAKLGLI